MNEDKLTLLILHVLADAEEEAGFMGQKFGGLTTDEITRRVNSLPEDRIRSIIGE